MQLHVHVHFKTCIFNISLSSLSLSTFSVCTCTCTRVQNLQDDQRAELETYVQTRSGLNELYSATQRNLDTESKRRSQLEQELEILKSIRAEKEVIKKSHPRQLISLCKSDCLGCVVWFCLVVCMTLLASFFLPSLTCT